MLKQPMVGQPTTGIQAVVQCFAGMIRIIKVLVFASMIIA